MISLSELCKGLGIAVNPLPDEWHVRSDYDHSIIVYDLHYSEGRVYGGSMPRRNVKEIERDSDGNYGGDFKFQLDLSERTFQMEFGGEKVIIDSNLGDYDYSPILFYYGWVNQPSVTLL